MQKIFSCFLTKIIFYRYALVSEDIKTNVTQIDSLFVLAPNYATNIPLQDHKTMPVNQISDAISIVIKNVNGRKKMVNDFR